MMMTILTDRINFDFKTGQATTNVGVTFATPTSTSSPQALAGVPMEPSPSRNLDIDSFRQNVRDVMSKLTVVEDER